MKIVITKKEFINYIKIANEGERIIFIETNEN